MESEDRIRFAPKKEPRRDRARRGSLSADDLEASQIVVAAVNSELEKVEQSFVRMFQVIEEAFDARVIRLNQSGEPIDLGPDHYARLAAAGSFIKLLTAGRPIPKAAEPFTDGGRWAGRPKRSR